MYYQNYEDYMRSVLGYPIEPENTYAAYSHSFENSQIYAEPTRNDNELLELYPEIYRIINPMVCKICEANTKPITRELVDQMTDEIYMNLEVQPEINTIVNIRANTQTANSEEGQRNSSNISNHATTDKNNKLSSSRSNSAISQNNITIKEKQNKENRETNKKETEDRQRRPDNRFLRDLIRILILNRLLGGFPNRPRPPRPHMPQRPPVRPPFPREDRFYENYLRY